METKKLRKEKRCHITELHEESKMCEEIIVSQFFNNLKEVNHRKVFLGEKLS